MTAAPPSELPTVAVVGLGYVGSVTAASLAARGVPVVGIDRRAGVVDAMARGQLHPASVVAGADAQECMYPRY